MHNRSRDITAYKTKDGSLIRELMHPQSHGNQNQSMAEAIVAPGQTTALHRHKCSEEIYHILHGEGLMTLADRQFTVQATDTICIAPGAAHCIKNTGQVDLHILCSCSPPYAHDDTELLD
jgi:mannose-6-phosphate isomerase-like protein (cupin superfamily)